MEIDTLTVITLCLLVSFVLSELFYKIKYPRVIGQIIAGLILGLPLFKLLITPELLLDIQFLADLGIIFLLLLVGLEINLSKFKRAKRDTLVIAAFSVLVPFLLGFILIKAMGYSNLIAFVVGASFCLTAEGTKLEILLDLKALNTKLGLIMLGAGILDDIFEVLFLSVVLIVAHESLSALVVLPFKLIAFVGFIYLCYHVFPFLLKFVQREDSRIAIFSFILLFSLVVAVVSDNLELGPIIGAFIAGIIIHISEHRRAEYKEIIRELKAITFAFIVPFFFINIGLQLNITTLTQNIWLTVMVVFVATTGKIVGALLATPFTDLSIRQTHLIGWGMNSRGAIELVIATFAYVNKIIPIEIYSAIVIMAVVTTLMFPLVMKSIISRDRSILEM